MRYYHHLVLNLKADSEGNNGKIGYSVQELAAKFKDTVANGQFG